MWDWIKRWLTRGSPATTAVSEALALLDKQGLRYDERLKQALDSLDRVIAARFDPPVVSDVQMQPAQSVFDADSLSDILNTDLTDDQFIERAKQYQ